MSEVTSRDRAIRPSIATPDQRVRVFVSSTLEELAEERAAAKAAITALRLTPVLFELGARPHPPRSLYRAYLEQSDVFIGIYGEKYGWIAPGEAVSGLEDEYLLSGDRPKLIYVKTPAPGREPRLEEMILRVWADDRASTRPYRTATELEATIADDVAVLLTERFTAARQAGGEPPQTGLRAPRLPVPPTPLVGRSADIAALCSLLHQPDIRLATVVGPGGIGKTRLVLEVASTLHAEFDGVWFVDLAPVANPLLVPAALAAELGIIGEGSRPVLDVIAERLTGCRSLLVLDNFEQVLSAADDVAHLLAESPGLRVLVTSRSLLQVRGERAFPLTPLDTPPAEARLVEAAASPAVQLFLARAQDVRPDFALTAENAPAVAAVVRRLDGIPLAIELAAARVQLLTPAMLLRRLDRRLDLQASDRDIPERQRTLRATVDWSHSLLGPAERALFAQLGVFAGGWTIEAAEAVGTGGGEMDVMETLSALVGHSLVTVDQRPEAEPRLRMLETIRDYARERLVERGEYDKTMRRLAAYLRDFSPRAAAGLAGVESRLWIERVDAELDNLRAALAWAVGSDEAELAIRIAAPLSRYWWSRSLLAPMLDLAEQTADLPSVDRLAPDAVALLLWCRGVIRIALGRVAEAQPFLQRLVEEARALQDDWLLAHGLTGLALTLPYETAAADMRGMLHEALDIFRRLGDEWGVAFVLSPLGQVAVRDGDPAAASDLHRQALTIADRIDDDQLRGQALTLLALDAMLGADVAGARRWLVDAAALHRRLQDREGLAYCLDAFAAVALATGAPVAAARLVGAATGIRTAIGAAVWPLMAPLTEGLYDGVRAAVGADADRRERAAGAALRPSDALDYAMASTADPPPGR